MPMAINKMRSNITISWYGEVSQMSYDSTRAKEKKSISKVVSNLDPMMMLLESSDIGLRSSLIISSSSLLVADEMRDLDTRPHHHTELLTKRSSQRRQLLEPKKILPSKMYHSSLSLDSSR